jgi:hypothetical protein
METDKFENLNLMYTCLIADVSCLTKNTIFISYQLYIIFISSFPLSANYGGKCLYSFWKLRSSGL